MLPVYHFLSWIAFGVGFLIGFLLLSLSKRHHLILLFLIGLSIGMHEHVFNQDQWFYPFEQYDSLIVKGESREPNPYNNALCIALKGPKLCPNKSDPRWGYPFYFGESKTYHRATPEEYKGTGVISPLIED